jgi:hypothetical protein
MLGQGTEDRVLAGEIDQSDIVIIQIDPPETRHLNAALPIGFDTAPDGFTDAGAFHGTENGWQHSDPVLLQSRLRRRKVGRWFSDFVSHDNILPALPSQYKDVP